MTIYSQHPNRGKVQILATYRGTNGVVSSTITRVDDVAQAGPIVDALNRISACATVPVSVFDTRGDGFDYYPSDHLAALTDRSARTDLLCGIHSLWYELAKTLLHQGLVDLDNAIAMVPPPVQTAVTAELEAEARGLRDAVAESSDGTKPPGSNAQREWGFQAPFVTFTDVDGLSEEDRDRLDRKEQGITDEHRRNGVADLRLLLEAHALCSGHGAMQLLDDFSITDDPFTDDEDRFFLNIEAPMPNGDYNRDHWQVVVGRWIPDDLDADEGSETGESVLRCVRSAPPTVDEIVQLFNRSGGSNDQIATWSKTAVGEPLAGTTFVVTERYED